MAYNDVVLADSPVYQYKLGETSGNALNTGSQGTSTLTVGSGVSRTTSGIPGNPTNGAMVFNGSSTANLSQSSHNVSYATDDVFTVETWFKTTDNDCTLVLYFASPFWYFNVNPNGTLNWVAGATTMTSPNAVNNGAWHHAVAVMNGTSHTLYLDGQQVATATGDPGTISTTGQFLIGDSRAQFAPIGTIDEVAIYNSALSSSRVMEHYTSGMGITNAGYVAQVVTASATMPGGDVPHINASYAAQVMNANALSADAVARTNRRTALITEDAGVNISSPDQNYGSSPIIDSNDAFAGTYFKVPAMSPAASGNEIVTSKMLYLTGSVEFVDTLEVHRVTSDWSESSITYNNRPSSTLVKTINLSWNAGTPTAIDIADVLSQTNYGVMLKGQDNSISSSEHATPSRRPYVVYMVAGQAAVTVPGQPFLASGLMSDPVTSTTSGVSTSGQPMNASALVVNPTVVTVRDAAVQVEALEAQAQMPAGSGYAMPATVTGNPFTASVDLVETQAGTTRGAIVLASPIASNAALKQPALVNGAPIIISEAEDDYFQRVISDNPKVWLRLNDQGSVAVDRMGYSSGVYNSVLVNQHDAPDNRHSVRFDGTGSIAQVEPNPDETTSYTGTLRATVEFSFRTTKTNVFIMAGSDYASSTNPPSTSPAPAREVFLRDGKIGFRTHYFANSLGNQQAPSEFVGFKNLSDGQWHSVVIKGYVVRFGEPGVEIWVDGKLEVRRVSAGVFTGFPDYIGSRPASIGYLASQNLGPLPSSQNFVGDMSEVVFYAHTNVDDNDIARHYYSFMGWKPIEAQPMESFAFATDGNTGKGNQKRALYLWWDARTDAYNTGGGAFNDKMNFDPMLGTAKGNPNGVYDYEGYKVFTRGVAISPNAADRYRDEVTDAPSLIDLHRHVDLDDYDLIMFGDWPDEGSEIDYWESFEPGGRDRIIRQLRDANDRGISLLVTHPRLAVDLGVVDRVELVPTGKETRFASGQGGATGLYDYGSASKFPWNIVGDAGLNALTVGSVFNGEPANRNPGFLASKAFFYGDANKNDRFRVRAVVEGLTDIPSYMIQDAVYYREYDLYGWGDVAYKYLHRMNGLLIGDEYIYHGTDRGMNLEAVSADFSEVRVGRWYGSFATPLANVKAGLVVTTFGQTQWVNQEQVANPYRDYATTIVLRPGDVLAGKPVVGKILVNFTEQPNRHENGIAVQVLPNDSDLPRGYKAETAEQKTWEYSFTRKTLTAGQINQTDTISVIGPSGQIISVKVGSAGENLVSGRSSHLFPLEAKPSFQMIARGLIWLGEREEVEPGSVKVASQPMSASTSVAEPVVKAQRDAGVQAQSMNSTAVLPKVREDKTGDVLATTLPLLAEATFTGFGKTISVAPMTAGAEFVENFESVFTTGEQVVLTFYGRDITLYMEEA